MAYKGTFPESRGPLRGTKSMAVFGASSKQPFGSYDPAYISPFVTFRPIPGAPQPPFDYFPPTSSRDVALRSEEGGYLDRSRPAPPPFHKARPKAPQELLGRLPRPRPVGLLRDDMEDKMNVAFLKMPEDCQDLVRMQVTQELWLRKAMDDEDAIVDAKMKYLVAMLEWLGNLQNGAHFLGWAQRVMDVTLRYLLSARGM